MTHYPVRDTLNYSTVTALSCFRSCCPEMRNEGSTANFHFLNRCELQVRAIHSPSERFDDECSPASQEFASFPLPWSEETEDERTGGVEISRLVRQETLGFLFACRLLCVCCQRRLIIRRTFGSRCQNGFGNNFRLMKLCRESWR